MEIYLKPLSDILAFNMKGHEFRILIRLKSRIDFESFYIKKRGEYPGFEELPKSTHIFSQQMANLQVSLVKHYNKTFNRSGTLMAGRFERRLVSSEEEVVELVNELIRGDSGHSYEGFWAEMGERVFEGFSKSYAEFKVDDDRKWAEVNGLKFDLVSQFKDTWKLQNYPSPLYFRRRFFRSLCKYHK